MSAHEEGRIRDLEDENRALRAEVQDIHAAREFYLKVFEDFPALIWRAGLDMNCDYFNRTWLEFTGRTLAQEVGDGWTKGVHPDDLDACFQTYVSHFQKHQAFSMFYRLKNRFGEYRWIKDMGRPFFSVQDEFLGYIGSCYDVTEERETSLKLEKANHSKDRFFSIIAHDLRGPVGAIQGLSEMLDQAEPNHNPDDEKVLMHEMSLAAAQTSRLLVDLLTWSQTQLQGTHWDPKPLILGPLVIEATAPLLDSLARKSLTLALSGVQELPLFADPHMIKTVIRNLVSNAIKFSPEGRTIEIEGTAKDGYTLVTFRDSGIGLSDKQLEELFQVGTGTHRPGTRGEPGTGLGLVICRDFVEKNLGKIWVESTEGQGTSVIIMLPQTA